MHLRPSPSPDPQRRSDSLWYFTTPTSLPRGGRIPSDTSPPTSFSRRCRTPSEDPLSSRMGSRILDEGEVLPRRGTSALVTTGP